MFISSINKNGSERPYQPKCELDLNDYHILLNLGWHCCALSGNMLEILCLKFYVWKLHISLLYSMHYMISKYSNHNVVPTGKTQILYIKYIGAGNSTFQLYNDWQWHKPVTYGLCF